MYLEPHRVSPADTDLYCLALKVQLSVELNGSEVKHRAIQLSDNFDLSRKAPLCRSECFCLGVSCRSRCLCENEEKTEN